MIGQQVYPREYTDVEGGNFKLWMDGPVTYEQLRLALKRAIVPGHLCCKVTDLNGLVVHSIAFETPAAGSGNYGRWDCLNGWTTSIENARRRFPNGLHGLKHMMHP